MAEAALQTTAEYMNAVQRLPIDDESGQRKCSRSRGRANGDFSQPGKSSDDLGKIFCDARIRNYVSRKIHHQNKASARLF
jgi:hypothetical protein